MPKGVPPQITRAVNRLENAAQNYAFKGAAHPDDWAAITQSYEDARATLFATITRSLKRATSPK